MNNFPKFGPNSQMSMAPNVPNISTGNPTIDMLMSMLLSGSGIAPRPMAGQSIQDAYIQRQRSMDFMEAMRTSFGNMPVAKRLGGMDTHSGWGSLVASFMGQPDGIVNNPIMRAFNGGNPVKAQMALLANMTGSTNYMGVSRIRSQADINASVRETTAMMQGTTNALFNHKRIDQADVDEYRRTKEKEALDYINENPGRRHMLGDRNKKFKGMGLITKDADGNDRLDLAKLRAKHAETGDNFDAPGMKNNPMSEDMKEEMRGLYRIVNDIKEREGKLGQKRITGMNLNKSRGYEVQDLTKAHTLAMDHSMFDQLNFRETAYKQNIAALGLKHGVAPTQAQQDAAREMARTQQFDVAGKYLPGVVRSMANLTGAKSAEEATNQLSSFLRNDYTNRGSSINLYDKGDADYAEKLLNRTKSVARNAGISIDALMQVIDTGKKFAAQHPGLQGLGGQAIVESSLKSFQATQMIAQAGGAGYVRQQGGLPAMTNNNLERVMRDKAEPISQQLTAAMGWVANQDLPENVKKAFREKAQWWSKNHDNSTMASAQMADELGSIVGRSGMHMRNYVMESKQNLKAGQAYDEEIQRDPNASDADKVSVSNAGQNTRFNMYDRAMGDRLWEEQQSRIQKNDPNRPAYLDENGAVIKTAEGLNDMMKKEMWAAAAVGKTPNQIAVKYGLEEAVMDNMHEDATAEERDEAVEGHIAQLLASSPDAAENMEYMEGVHRRSAMAEAMANRRGGKLYASIGTAIAQEFMNASPGDNVNKLMESIAEPAGKKRFEAISNKAYALNTDHSAENTNDLFYELYGGAKGTNKDDLINNMRAQGKTEEEIQAALYHRGVYNEEDFKAIDKAAAGGLTGDQLFEMAKDANKGTKWKENLMKKAGMSEDDLSHATRALYHTGIWNNRTQKKFGKKVMSMDTVRDMVLNNAAVAATEIARVGDQAAMDKEGGEGVEASLSALEGGNAAKKAEAVKIRKLLAIAGINTADGKGLDLLGRDATADEALIIGGIGGLHKFGENDMTEAALNKRFKGKSIYGTDKSIKALVDAGMADVDKDGKIKGVNTDKIKKMLAVNDLRKELKDTGVTEDIKATVKGISDSTDAYNKYKDDADEASGAKDKDPLSAAMAAGAATLGGPLEKIAAALGILSNSK